MTVVWDPIQFPGSIDTFGALQDNIDEVVDNHPNTLASGILAVENKLNIDNEPVKNTGGLEFHASGKAANPGGVSRPTIWVDNTGGAGFPLKYTDDQGTTIELGSGGGGGGSLQDSYNIDTRIVLTTSVDPGNGGPVDINIPTGVDSPALQISNDNATDKPHSLVISHNTGSGSVLNSAGIFLTGSVTSKSIIGDGNLMVGSRNTGIGPSVLSLGSNTEEGNSIVYISAYASTSGNVSATLDSYVRTGFADAMVSASVDTGDAEVYMSSYVELGDAYISVESYSEDGAASLSLESYTDSGTALTEVVAAGSTSSVRLRAGGFIYIAANSGAGVTVESNTNEYIRLTANGNGDIRLSTNGVGGKIDLVSVDTIKLLTNAAIQLVASDTIQFTDSNKAGSVWTDYLRLSDDVVEWNDYHSRVGPVSLINAIAQAYDAGGGGGGGTPGGTGTEVQYRVDASNFGGMSTASYDTSDNALIIGGDTTTSPLASLADLWVCKENYSTLAVSSATTSTIQAPYLRFVRYRGSYSSHTGITTGDWLGVAEWRAAYSSTSSLGLGAQMYASASENWDALNRGVLWQLKVTRNGGTDPITRYRVNGDGSQDFISYNASPAFYIPAVDQGAVFGSDNADSSVVNGHVYYNSSLNKFRACENGSWTDLISAGGSTSPGGSDTQIQYNNSGAFGGVSVMHYATSAGAVVFGTESVVPSWYSGQSSFLVAELNEYSVLAALSASTSSNHHPAVNLTRSGGTFGIPAAVSDNWGLGDILFRGVYNSSGDNITGARIYSRASGDWSASNYGTELEIRATKENETSETVRYLISGTGVQKFFYDGTNAALTIPDGSPGAIFGTDTADPTTVNGHVYYNSTSNKFRAYENGAWTDLIVGVSDLQTSYNNGYDIDVTQAIGAVTIRIADGETTSGLYVISNNSTDDPPVIVIENNAVTSAPIQGPALYITGTSLSKTILGDDSLYVASASFDTGASNCFVGAFGTGGGTATAEFGTQSAVASITNIIATGGTGSLIQLRMNSATQFAVNLAGAVSVTPNSGQNCTITTLGTGSIVGSSQHDISFDYNVGNTQSGEFTIDNNGTMKFKIDSSGNVIQAAPTSAPTLSDNGTVSLYLDETGNNLKVAVRYSDGTTKTATVALV